MYNHTSKKCGYTNCSRAWPESSAAEPAGEVEAEDVAWDHLAQVVLDRRDPVGAEGRRPPVTELVEHDRRPAQLVAAMLRQPGQLGVQVHRPAFVRRRRLSRPR